MSRKGGSLQQVSLNDLSGPAFMDDVLDCQWIIKEYNLSYSFPGSGGSSQPNQGGSGGGNFQDDGDDDLYS